MIVSSHNHKFQLFTQYDHSILSGDFVPYWKHDLFFGKDYYQEVQTAIREHDRAWIPLDQKPIWNEEEDKPHSFMDYPTKQKLEAYTQGVDEVENLSVYAGYLNSKHFLSFFDLDSTDYDISRFISREIDRQKQIEQTFSNQLHNGIIDFHFKLLQFCDDFSLYICLNQPGTNKEDEIFMFKDGFRQKFLGIENKMNAYWRNEDEILLTPFPFSEPFNVQVSYKELNPHEIEQVGLQQAYDRAQQKIRRVKIVNK